jgi:hypothetical protein
MRYGTEIATLVASSTKRVLVAPHHGRTSGYSEDLIATTSPNLIVISDEYGKEPTDSRFRTKASGLEHNAITGELRWISPIQRLFDLRKPPTLFEELIGRSTNEIKYLSMKSTGRLQFKIDSNGACNLHIVDS